MRKSKFVFLLAAFKTAFLKESIESILAQTYQDFRLVVSDDCSPEDVKGVVEQFDDDRVCYVRNEQNIGGFNLVDHWNLELERDAGDCEYVIMASDDDVYEKEFLANVDSLTLKYPHVDLLRGRSVNSDNQLEPVVIDDPSDEFQSELHFAADMYNGRHIRSFANFVFRTSALQAKGGFVKFPYAWYSDVVSTLMMAKQGVAHTLKPVFYYRGSDQSISSSRKNKEVVKGKLEAALMNHKWMNDYIYSLQYEETKLNVHRKSELISHFRHDSYATIVSYLWVCPLWQKIKIYRSLKQQPVFGKAAFWKIFLMYYTAKIIRS